MGRERAVARRSRAGARAARARRWWVAIAATALAWVPPAGAAIRCTGDGSTPQRFSVSVPSLGPNASAVGYYVAPKADSGPKGLVVFSHGHTASPIQWFGQMARVAQRDGLIAIAMYYPGELILDPPKDDTTFGWRVREGAQAGIAAAQAFLDACPGIRRDTFVDYGVSMGGNTSGLIAAAGATRPGTHRPLFDYWFDIEGVTNVIETYLEATLVAQIGNKTGIQAKREIEQENGGTPAQQPARYADLAVLTHAPQIKAGGIKGVVLVHGIDDGTVPYDQTPEMNAALTLAGVPTDMYSVATKTPGSESGSTLDGLLPVPHDSPFAGHGGEGSQTQLVIQTGLAALDRLFQRHDAPSGHRAFLVDGTLGKTLPSP